MTRAMGSTMSTQCLLIQLKAVMRISTSGHTAAGSTVVYNVEEVRYTHTTVTLCTVTAITINLFVNSGY